MPDWQNRINQIVQDARATPTVEVVDEFENVLQEVIAALNSAPGNDFFRVAREVERVGNLRRVMVSTFPRRRPAERSIMLSLAFDGHAPMVPTPAGLGYLRTPTPDGFRVFLLEEFFGGPGFQATLRSYFERNSEPVDAWLHMGSRARVTLSDVGLELTTVQQDVLVAAIEAKKWDSQQVVEATLQPISGNFRGFSEDAAYQFLNSCGIVLRVSEVHKVGGERMRVSGVLEQDLQPRYLQ